jgi:hypothetical protein
VAPLRVGCSAAMGASSPTGNGAEAEARSVMLQRCGRPCSRKRTCTRPRGWGKGRTRYRAGGTDSERVAIEVLGTQYSSTETLGCPNECTADPVGRRDPLPCLVRRSSYHCPTFRSRCRRAFVELPAGPPYPNSVGTSVAVGMNNPTAHPVSPGALLLLDDPSPIRTSSAIREAARTDGRIRRWPRCRRGGAARRGRTSPCSTLRSPMGWTSSRHAHAARPAIVAIVEDSFNYITKMCTTRLRDATIEMTVRRERGCRPRQRVRREGSPAPISGGWRTPSCSASRSDAGRGCAVEQRRRRAVDGIAGLGFATRARAT